jgi:hypothetical protein
LPGMWSHQSLAYPAVPLSPTAQWMLFLLTWVYNEFQFQLQTKKIFKHYLMPVTIFTLQTILTLSLLTLYIYTRQYTYHTANPVLHLWIMKWTLN